MKEWGFEDDDAVDDRYGDFIFVILEREDTVEFMCVFIDMFLKLTDDVGFWDIIFYF